MSSSRNWILALVLFAVSARAQGTVDRDFEFARRLIDNGFADYAERLVDELTHLDPTLKDRATITRVDIMSARGKFEDAEKLLATLPGANPKTQAARLVLAKRYYAARQMDKARGMFDEFFKQYKTQLPSDADLLREFQDAAYQYGQMLENMGDYGGAASAYLRILDTKPDLNIARRIQAESAAMLTRAARTADSPAKRDAYLNRAYKLCEAIQWDTKGSTDLWFVSSISTQAQIEMARGRPEQAEKIIHQNLDLISGVDDLLKDEGIPISMSPMAPARFVLGEVRENKGRKLLNSDNTKALKLMTDALKQYLNVFAKYGASDWGPDAGTRGEKLYKDLIAHGVSIKPIDWGQYAGEIIKTRTQQADNFFLQKKYDEAARAYLQIIGAFASRAGPVFANLTVCYAATQNLRYLDATVDHICERYRNDPTAGLGLISAAKFYFDSGDTNQCVALYRRYVDAYPKTDRTASILYLTATMMKRIGQAEGGDVYLQRLIRDFKGDRNYLLALQQMGQTRYEQKDYDGAIEALKRYIADSVPSPARGTVQALLADAYFRKNDFARAVQEYRTLSQWMEPSAQNPYAKTDEETARARKYLETAQFFSGFALTKITEPPEMIPQLKAKAVEELESFIRKNPKSELASKALYVIGTAHLGLGDVDAAARDFDRLQTQYKETEEGKNAGVSLVLAALDIGKKDLARDTLRGMLLKDPPGKPPSAYTVAQLASVGARFFSEGMFEEAEQVLSKVILAESKERAIRERTLHDLGVSFYRLKKYDDAIRQLENLLVSYPNSALFYSAKMNLGRAYRDAGRLDEAVLALSDVFNYAEDAVIRDSANLTLAEIQVLMAHKAKAENKTADADKFYRQAAASYKRIVDLSDRKNKELLPLIEQAAFAAVGTYEEMGRIADAVKSCDVYLTLFSDRPNADPVRRKRNELMLKPSAQPPPEAAPAVP